MNLPIDIIKIIIEYKYDLQILKCHICNKKIKNSDKFIKLNKFSFCSNECYLFN